MCFCYPDKKSDYCFLMKECVTMQNHHLSHSKRSTSGWSCYIWRLKWLKATVEEQAGKNSLFSLMMAAVKYYSATLTDVLKEEEKWCKGRKQKRKILMSPPSFLLFLRKRFLKCSHYFGFCCNKLKSIACTEDITLLSYIVNSSWCAFCFMWLSKLLPNIS